MPIRVHLEGDLLHLDFSGAITWRELNEMVATVRALEQSLPRVPDRIADLSATTAWDIGFPEVDQVAAGRKALTFPNAFKTAIVAPQPVQVGFARMFQTLNTHPQITIRVFPDRAMANAWLTAPSPPAHS